MPFAFAARPWLADVYRATIDGKAPLTYRDAGDGRNVVGLDAAGGPVSLLDQGVIEARHEPTNGPYVGLGRDGDVYVMWR